MAPLLLPLVWRHAWARRLFWGAWIPALVAGITVAWSSTNGYTNAGIGMLPAALVSAVYLLTAVHDAVESFGNARLSPVPVLAVLILLGIGLHYQRGLYLGGEILARKRPVTRVDWGPYRGLRSVTAKDDYLRALASDLEPLVRPDARILFYDHFPPGYLLFPMRPATPSIYSCYLLTAPGDPELCARHYARTLSEPSIAVRIPPLYILGTRLRPDPPSDLATHRTVQRQLQPVVARTDRQGQELYQIYSSEDPKAGL
jgi:hypothetical protein